MLAICLTLLEGLVTNVYKFSHHSNIFIFLWKRAKYVNLRDTERQWRDMAGLEKNRGRMQWKELPENVEKFCICVTQHIRNWRPVFTRKVTSKCSRDPLAPEDIGCGLRFVWVLSLALELAHIAGLSWLLCTDIFVCKVLTVIHIHITTEKLRKWICSYKGPTLKL